MSEWALTSLVSAATASKEFLGGSSLRKLTITCSLPVTLIIIIMISSIYLSVYLSVYVSVDPSVNPSIYPSIHLISQYVYPSTNIISISLSNCLSICTTTTAAEQHNSLMSEVPILMVTSEASCLYAKHRMSMSDTTCHRRKEGMKGREA